MAAADDYVLEVPQGCWKVHCVFGLEGTGTPYPQLKTPVIIEAVEELFEEVVKEVWVQKVVRQSVEKRADDEELTHDEELTQILEGCGMYQPGGDHVDVSNICSTLVESCRLEFPGMNWPYNFRVPQEEEQEPTQPTPPIQEVKWAAEVPETIGDIQEKVKWAAWVPETIVDVQ